MSIIHRLFAATEQINPSEIGIDDPVTNANAVVGGVLDTVYAWAGILCVIVIIVAGYLYTTANANAQRIKRAKDAIVYATVGLIVVAMAFVITQFVIGRF
jgi:hypothetical protein